MKSGTFLEVPGPLLGRPAGGAGSPRRRSLWMRSWCSAGLGCSSPRGSKPLHSLWHEQHLKIKAGDQRLRLVIGTDAAVAERKTLSETGKTKYSQQQNVELKTKSDLEPLTLAHTDAKIVYLSNIRYRCGHVSVPRATDQQEELGCITHIKEKR